jgi:peroxiredoxin
LTRRSFLLAVAALLAFGLLRSFRASPVRLGAPAPAFRLAGLNGQTVSLSDYRGKAVLLNFWATWCPDCREEFPVLEALQRRFHAEGLEVLAASVDDSGRKAVLPFVARQSPTFTILLADPAAAKAYGIRGIPATFLIGPDGVVARRYIGAVELRRLENDIVKVLPRRRS